LFTFIIYQQLIISADSFWSGYHLMSLWVLGALFDLMTLLLLAVIVLSLKAVGSEPGGSRAQMTLERIAEGVRRLDNVVIWIAGAVLAIMVLITFVSVIGRATYKPLPDDITMAEWALVLLVSLMLGTLQGREDHIEVTALSDILSFRWNLYLRVFGCLVGLTAITRLSMVSFAEVPDSFLEITYGSIYELPAWPPRFFFMVGLAWWLTRIAIQAVMLPVLIRLHARDALGEFGPAPLLSQTGLGDDEIELGTLTEVQSDKVGGARGT
jgi:TRAP-type C4-dicarboxylate transport system permease small subunit